MTSPRSVRSWRSTASAPAARSPSESCASGRRCAARGARSCRATTSARSPRRPSGRRCSTPRSATRRSGGSSRRTARRATARARPPRPARARATASPSTPASRRTSPRPPSARPSGRTRRAPTARAGPPPRAPARTARSPRMGELGGFLKINRVDGRKRPIGERVHDFSEFQLGLTVPELCEQGARCMECGVPFCHSGCPLGNLIPDWNDLVYRDRWREAIDALHATNNFPEFTGRICPAPCEAACVLDINDDAVTIKQIEQAIADRAFDEGWVVPEQPPYRTGKTAAVVGSGPAGLAAAAELNKRGHTVTLFERNTHIGGLLRFGVPDFKLDKGVVQRRVDILEQEGIEMRTGVNVGVDITADELREQYDAVVLTIGSTIPRDLPVPGRELDGVHFAMEYLELRNRFVAGEFPDGTPTTAAEKHVVIIGGGDTGADCLGNSHRENPKSITQFELLPEPPPERPDDLTPWPRWPLILRTSGAHEEGGERRYSVMTIHLSGEDGRVAQLHGTEVGPPPEFKKVEGSEFTIAADLVLLAMGFLHPQHEGIVEQFGLATDGRGNIVDDGFATSVEGVFAAGDARRGQSLIVWAIAEGRQAARSADAWLSSGEELRQEPAAAPAPA